MTDERQNTPAAKVSEPAEDARHTAQPQDQVVEAARLVSEAFLGAHPGRYFRTRAIRWAQTADQPTDPDEPTWPATEAGDQVKDRLGEYDYVLGRQADAQAASTLDAFMLAHHAGESLMRHFFSLLSATTNPIAVPWLEMVTLQEGREFRRRLRIIVDASDEVLDEAIGALFVPPALATVIREEASRANGQDSGKTNDATADSDNADAGEDVLADTYRFCRAWLQCR